MDRTKNVQISTLVMATRNQDKVKEIAAVLDGLNVELLTLDRFHEFPETIEDGETFLDNARKKAWEVFKETGVTALADDSGLEVDALDGAPGVYSARYSGESATYDSNNQKLLDALKSVPDEKRTARFVCVLALVGDNLSESFTGIAEGTITRVPRGTGGFGYDPVFELTGLGKTYAEVPADVKNETSHRARALGKFRAFVEAYLNR